MSASCLTLMDAGISSTGISGVADSGAGLAAGLAAGFGAAWLTGFPVLVVLTTYLLKELFSVFQKAFPFGRADRAF